MPRTAYVMTNLVGPLVDTFAVGKRKDQSLVQVTSFSADIILDVGLASIEDFPSLDLI